MPDIFVTLTRLNEETFRVVNFVQFENIKDVLVADVVSKLDKSRLVNEVQLLNMFANVVTEDVLKLEIDKGASLTHAENIVAIDVT